MGILKSKPKLVEIYAPRTLVVGTESAIEIVIHTEDAVEVEYIEARLVGTQGWRVGSGKQRITHEVIYPELVARLMEAGELAAATTTRLAARFTLPLGTPPTHALAPAWADLVLRVRVAIPWWPDGKYRFVLPTRLPAPRVMTRTAAATSSQASADQPRIELALASTRLIAGEIVVGSCALFHLDDREPREVRVDLTPRLTLHRGRRTRHRNGDGFGIALTLPAGSAGASVPFQFVLPATMTPSFETVTHQLQWFLTATSGSFLRGKVEVTVPIEIVDASASATTERLSIAPRLGAERVAELLDRFAARSDWRRAFPTADDPDELAIVHAVAGSELRVAYTYRGRDGTYLVARLAHPHLGLGLAVAPGSTLRHVFFEDVEVGIAAWDRAHLVGARSADQTIPLLRGVVPTLMRAPWLGTLVRWADDELMLERSITTLEETDLAATATTLEQLAVALATAAEAIAPPPGVTVDVVAWRELAAWLDGELAPGDLSIAGQVDLTAVDLGLEWDADGRPTGVRVSVGDPAESSAELRAQEAVARPAGWPDDTVELRLADGVASALWRLPAGEAPIVDPVRVRRLVEALCQVRAALEPAAPYR